MWDKLRRQLALEREHIRHLLETHSSLLSGSTEAPPGSIQISALAAMLHSFYTGIENMFKRIALEVDSSMPTGEFWHRELLRAMADHTSKRPPVISRPLWLRLREYLEFRHVFRQAYAFELKWDKMRSLVLGCEGTLHQLEAELDTFLELYRE